MERLRRLRRLLRRSTPVAARGPFSNEDPTTPRDHVRRDQRLRAMGVRLLPHPFASLMTIMSDIDAAERADAEAYRRQLVEVHGLDFGDSFRLALRTHGRMGSEAFALYHCTGAPPPAGDADRDLDTTCTFLEIVRAYHLGHVDHLHGLSGMGPRVAWLRDVRTGGADTVDVMVPADFEIEKRGSMNVRSDFMPVLRIAVLAPARLPATTDVRFIDASGREIATLARLEDPAAHATGVHTDDVATWFAPPESLSPVRLGDIACVRISGGGTVRAVAMVNLARPHLKAMLRDLGDRWQVRPCLYTDHGAKGFLTATSEAHHASGNAACLADATAAALYARVVDPAYGYSTFPDDPASTAYILDEFVGGFGLRCINPSGSSGEPRDGFELLDAVVPSAGRDGVGVYVARRCQLVPKGLPKDARRDQGTRSFPARLARALELATARPGRAWPLYTHLGNLQPKSDRADPYFPAASIEALQDAVMNVSGTIAPSARVWFARASIAIDYIIMLRSIAPHVRRPTPDAVAIRSWRDETLRRTMPVGPTQLHGFTFDVSDPAAATVTLDERPIEELTRNPPDRTGRPSVTIVGAGIRHIVLDECDPVETFGGTSEAGVTYTWHDDGAAARGRARASLRIDRDGATSVSWSPRDLKPYGAAYVAWSIRRPRGSARFALVIETVSGGRFRFGEAIGEGGSFDATRAVIEPSTPAEDWRRCVVPLYDLAWRAGARPGGPLPAHEVATVRLVVDGGAGEVVEVDAIEYLRPSTSIDAEATMTVIGGQVVPPTTGGTVTIDIESPEGVRTSRTTRVEDPRGLFAFADVPLGSRVAVWTTAADGRRVVPTRGVSEMVLGPDLSLHLDAS